MSKMTVKEKKHFDELNLVFQRVCKNEKKKGCSCPSFEYKGENIKLFGQQVVKGLGVVPCEARCKWDLERHKKFYEKSDRMIIEKVCKTKEVSNE